MAKRPRTIDIQNPFVTDLTGICEVLLVRHGEQHFEADMAVGAGIDTALTELGRRQATAVGDRLASIDLAAIYSSTRQRARDTGVAIAGHHELEVHQLQDLVEIDLYRKLPQDQTLRESLGEDAMRDMLREANRTRRWDAYPYVEPLDEFRGRVIAAIDGIIADHHGEQVVVACHGGVINTYLSHILQSAIDIPCSIHHTSITTVRGSGDIRRVLSVNDYAHVLPFQTAMNPLNAG